MGIPDIIFRDKIQAFGFFDKDSKALIITTHGFIKRVRKLLQKR